jgi:uncharacterized protein (TIGR03435 family)
MWRSRLRIKALKYGLLLIALAAPVCAWSQAASVPVAVAAPATDAKMPAFDVVSVKVNNSGSKMGRVMYTPDGLSVSNVPLIGLLRVAYGMFNSTNDMIAGMPSWGTSQQFDIEAKMSEADVAKLKTMDPANPTKPDQQLRQLMLQSLLADRFKMTAHKETKVLPVYDLVIAKSGSKLKEATPDDPYANGIKAPDGKATLGTGGMRLDRGKMNGQAISTDQMASWMWQEVGRTVINKTGLTGKYDVTLQWVPENHSAAMSADQTQSTEAAGPSIFTALQEQLGLKLEPAKGPVETLVIDHVEMPSAN